MLSFRKQTTNQKTEKGIKNVKTILSEAKRVISVLRTSEGQRSQLRGHCAMMAVKKKGTIGMGGVPTHFIVDSGCSDHMSNASLECFVTYSRVDTPITTAEAGGNLRCAGVGSMMLSITTTTGSVVTIVLDKVLHVPSLTENLLSVSSLSAIDGNGMATNKHGATLFAGDLHFDAPRNGQGLYQLPVRIITRSQGHAGTLHLHQGGYIEQVLCKFGFQDCKPEASPTSSVGLDTVTPSTEKEKKEMQEVPFRNALGCLLWLATNARPDIAYAVHQVARRAADPTMEAWTAIKRIFRYLKGTPTLGVTFRRSGSKSTSNDDVLTCYSDTDWAGESSRYTTASSQVYIWGALIANKVKLLKNIALSSMEAELMGYSETGKLGLYIINLLREMHMDHLIHQPVPVYGDNDAARLAVLRQGRTSRTRHIEVRHFWVREKVNEGIFRMERVATEDNPADIGTKPLSAKRFTQLVKKVIKELPAGAKKFKGKKS